MQLVMELTDVSKPSDGNRSARKEIDRKHLAGISPRAKTVKLADLIDNTRDITSHDLHFARVYLKEMTALLEVLTEGDSRLDQKAQLTIESGARKLLAGVSGSNHDIDDHAVDPAGTGGFVTRHGLGFFIESFTAKDILEPVPSFDFSPDLEYLQDRLAGGEFALVGIRRDGLLTEYLTSCDTADDTCRLKPRRILARQTLEIDAPLVDVIHVLTSFDTCFVTLAGAIIGAVGRSDMEKPVVRMWLFGLIMLIDMSISKSIKSAWTDNSWHELVSPQRLAKAHELLSERQRRHLGGDLLDCLQISDKTQLAIQIPAFFEQSGFVSIKSAKRVFKDLEGLRNNLAHGQDITRTDWPSIVRLARQLGALAR